MVYEEAWAREGDSDRGEWGQACGIGEWLGLESGGTKIEDTARPKKTGGKLKKRLEGVLFRRDECRQVEQRWPARREVSNGDINSEI